MKEQKKEEARYVGIDLGKRSYEVAVVAKNGKVTMSNGKTHVCGRQALYRKLRAGDKVALEAGNLAFIIAKELEAAAGCKVYVLNPSQLAVIYKSMKKTDKEDALKLAHILEDVREERLPVVPVPEKRIEALNRRIKKESAGDGVIERLQSVPGVGPVVAFAFVSHVAAERFENAGQVSNYLGLVPRVYMSGDTVRYGRITKRGNGYLRALLVRAARALTRTKKGGKLKERYEYMTLEKSVSKKKAIVAIARRMAELLYVLMRDGQGMK